MREKMEVYPFQRVGQASTVRRRPDRWHQLYGLLPDINAISLQGRAAGAALHSLLSAENALLAVAALIMARAFILGELLPFMFAFLVAFSRKSFGRGFILGLGAIIGLFSVLQGLSLWSNILTILVLLAITRQIKISQSRLWLGLPLVTASTIFVVKSLLLLGSTFTFYREMVVVFEALISAVLTFISLVGEEVITQRKPLAVFTFEDRSAFIVMGIGLIMGLNDIHLAGLSVGAILCRLGILLTAYLWGSGGGTMVGVMSGIIPSITSKIFAPSIGMYGISGLLAGLFRNFGQIGSIIGFMLGNLAFAMFMSEDQASLMGIWETGIAALIFFILPTAWKERMAIQSLGPVHSMESGSMQLAASQLEGITRNRMEELAHIFDEMSGTFLNAERDGSSGDDRSYLSYLYSELSQGICSTCTRYERCWEREAYQTSRELLDIFSLAESQGEIAYAEVSGDFKRRCIKGSEMVVETNRLFDKLRINEYWALRFHQSRQLVSLQLKGVSQVIKNLIEEMGARAILKPEVRQVIIKEMNRLGIRVKDVSVLEQGDRQLLLSLMTDACADGQYCESCIAPAVSSLLGEKLEIHEKQCPRGRDGICQIVLGRGFVYRVCSGAAQIGKEQVCGDSFTIATLQQGKELIALSDGMGVGEKAWGESQAAVRLLENLLGSGFDQETTLKTINSILLLRSATESFATLDMAMVDLYEGGVDFIKIGSAPSFIKHGRQVSTIESNSLPIGILENIEPVSEHWQLQIGDMLVQVSDGILENPRKGQGELWVQEYLAILDENDPQRVAECLIHKALSLCRGKPADDMTVICARLELNHEH
ncbi:MAG TPA: stage II sporulation protein E [Syntrophomonadaceae bacterium]|nr:stage II sporulation protein E [Syntrophomonadaceae bacterium]